MAAENFRLIIEDIIEKLEGIDEDCQKAILADLGIDADQWVAILQWLRDFDPPADDVDLFTFFTRFWQKFNETEDLIPPELKPNAAFGLAARASALNLRSMTSRG